MRSKLVFAAGSQVMVNPWWGSGKGGDSQVGELVGTSGGIDNILFLDLLDVIKCA